MYFKVEGKSKTVHGSLWGQRERDLGVKGTGILGERGMRGREVELLSHGRNKRREYKWKNSRWTMVCCPTLPPSIKNTTAKMWNQYYRKTVIDLN